MLKKDLKKERKQYYNPSSRQVEWVDVPEYSFLMCQGEDARIEGPVFTQIIQALFPVAYKVKFMSKKELELDFSVMPLEGLWWADDMDDFLHGRKERWKYSLMIAQPDFINAAMIDEAVAVTAKKDNNPFLKELKLESFTEGPSVQIMHLGPFSEEHANIQRLHNAIHDRGEAFDGQVHKHHEIYLSDFRRTDPQKLRTVLRQPYAKKP